LPGKTVEGTKTFDGNDTEPKTVLDTNTAIPPNSTPLQTKTLEEETSLQDSSATAINAVDSATPAPQPNKKAKQVFVKNSISPVIGYGASSVVNTGTNKFGTLPYLGLMYHRYIDDRWQASAGLGYTQVNATGLTKTFTNEQYSFGVQKDQTTISTNKLHYLQIPIQLRYSPANRFTILGGFTAGYLLNTKNSLSQTSYASLKGHSNSPATAKTAYRNGINNWDLQWQIGFETHFLNNRLHLGLLANGGLTDVTRNTYYNNSVFDRNRRLQLYIRYDVYRF
jgi:hypothetical protein